MPFITIIFFGILASCFALIFEFIIHLPVTLLSQSAVFSPVAAFSLFGLALIEETSKYIFLRQYALHYLNTTTPKRRNMFLLGILFGVGFSLLELALSLQNVAPISFLPIFGRIVLHTITSLILAYSTFQPSDPPSLLRIFRLILAVTLIHFAYNTALF